MERLKAKTLISQAIRDMDLQNANRRMDAMIDWVFEAETLIGTKDTYIRKECELEIENWRARLPHDFYKLVSVKNGDNYPEYTGRDFKLFIKGGSNDTGNANLADRNSGDSISNVNHEIINGLNKFYISDGYINITAEQGSIGIAYMSLPIDSDNMPLVHPNHAEAVTAYLIWKYMTADWIKGKVSGSVYGELKQRWLELVGVSRGKDGTPSRREMDYIGGIWNNLKLPPPNTVS